jgi:hypothetical protein
MSADTQSSVVEGSRMSSISFGKSLTQPPTSFADRLLKPIRRLLARLLGPMMGREEELFASLEMHIEQIQHQQRKLDALVRQVEPDDTAERIIACEERIQHLESLQTRSGR